MDRREFLQNVAATTVGHKYLKNIPKATEWEIARSPLGILNQQKQSPELEGHTPVCEFKVQGEGWTVYEDLRARDGAIIFISSRGPTRVLTKSAEASFAEADPAYLGLNLSDIGMSDRDLLAEKLLAGGGDPDLEMVKSAAAPQGSARAEGVGARERWDTFVGTKECFDTAPVYPSGSTRTYHPNQYLAELRGPLPQKRFDGLVGGWMPAVRKVIPISDSSYCEMLVFGDVQARDQFIVQTWHRSALIENGKFSKVFYGHSYPAFPPARQDPEPQEFYRALLLFADYWDRQLGDFPAASLPDRSWLDMAKHAFAKELMVRPGGVYPKYGAVDRDYYGSEYDGFQDTFTSSVYANLEWGRFEQARAIIDNYLSDFTDGKGMINMRGPETAQFGLTLSLLARYFHYTRDSTLILKHRAKIRATAKLLCDLHDESLRIAQDDPGHGLIHGWSESDASLAPTPSMARERPNPHEWAHRPYCELLEADVLPPRLADRVVECMRAFGATTLGVVANVGRPRRNGRAILGFISYGYAQALLRLDRIEEFLLFLYSHRYHCHTRGSWTAGEVSGITGGTALFCIPAQLTIPLLLRWMLVFEDSDDERLYLAKAVPRDWIGSGQEIRVVRAPTRWGKVNFHLVAHDSSKTVVAKLELGEPGAPKEVHVKLRLPVKNVLETVSVNGQRIGVSGVHNDTAVIATGKEKDFEIVGQYR